MGRVGADIYTYIYIYLKQRCGAVYKLFEMMGNFVTLLYNVG